MPRDADSLADRLTDVPGTFEAPAARRGLREAALARLLRQLSMGSLIVVTPEGRRLVGRGRLPGPEATLVLHRWRALRRLVTGGDIAFSQAYIAGDWSSPDLPALIELAAHNLPVLAGRIDALPPVRLWNRLRHALRGNSKTGSRRNISFHYDLGNDFYRAWLDAGMSYSSAIAIAPGQTLEEAQQARLARIVDMLEVAPGQSVLEIGCGWGGLAATLARAGTEVTGITLSREQLAYGQAMLAADPSLAGRATLRLQDYRDVAERYDRVVSIEMLEAVGEAYWPTYFAKLRACLKEGGTAVLQVITIAEDRFEGYRRHTDFIQRHIFPGGMLPTKTHLARHAQDAGLDLVETQCFGLGYAQTLAEWRARFLNAWPDVAQLGFDADFRRLWEYYLAYCEGGFRAGAIDVGLYRLKG
ncbi:class I SAM-dependent methyltransferase [Ancylobacter sp.]|uniref:class I SAM-dependent methyltransferase n=1 Tax=Ancylobacter sp. TaxID=1872567 RepID=UPI003D10CB1B